jgi:branched-chain amino acid transport system permease protein
MVSFGAIMTTLVGGVGSFFGPIVGTAIFQILQELTTRFTERVEIVTGVIIIAIIMFAPMGFVGLMNIAKMKWLTYYSVKFKKVKAEKIS